MNNRRLASVSLTVPLSASDRLDGSTAARPDAGQPAPGADPALPAPAAVLPDALLLTDRQAAALCGLGRSTWHRLRAAGKLPLAVRLGRALRWRRQEIEAWISAGCPDARTWTAMTAAHRRRGAV
jgi:excisionase family DNA binding protein